MEEDLANLRGQVIIPISAFGLEDFYSRWEKVVVHWAIMSPLTNSELVAVRAPQSWGKSRNCPDIDTNLTPRPGIGACSAHSI